MVNKKEKTIIGEVIHMTVGEPARIRTDAGIMQTSNVVHTIQHPSGEVWIETAHTKYTVVKSAARKGGA